MPEEATAEEGWSPREAKLINQLRQVQEERTNLKIKNRALEEELQKKQDKEHPLPSWFDATQHHNVAGLCKTIDSQFKTIKDMEAQAARLAKDHALPPKPGEYRDYTGW